MSTAPSRLEQLRSAGPRDAVRLVYRKAIYRKVVMGRWGARAADHIAPERPVDLRIDIVGPEAFDVVLGTTPYLTVDDVTAFRRQDSTCITASDGATVVASSWMTRGEVWVNELQRTVSVPEGEHFSCRSFVDPAQRGRALLSHMLVRYAAAVEPSDVIWGLVYDWNVASRRSLERIGWTYSGDEWTTHVLGRQRSGSTHIA